MAVIRSSLVEHGIHHAMAHAFYSSVFNRTSDTYMFFGKILPWDVDTVPDVPTKYFLDEYDTRNNMVHLTRILPSNVCFVIKRNQWAYGTLYDKYDPAYSPTFKSVTGATSLYSAKMFVITSDYNIYKCIDNNSGAVSTVMPTGTPSTGYITTSDNFVWKYMGSVSSLARQMFLSSQWVPVANVVGGIEESFKDSIVPKVNFGGTGYSPENTKISVLGDGVGADVRPIIQVTDNITIGTTSYPTGTIIGLQVVNPGVGYTFADVEIQTPDPQKPEGTGAQISVTFPILDVNLTQVDVQLSAVSGDISSIELLNGGVNYTSATATVVGDGTGATIAVELLFGRITKLTLTNRGSGYTYASIVITGTGSGAEAKIVVSPRNGHGFDIIQESMANTLAFYKTLSMETNYFFDTFAPYRQSGLLINPGIYPIDGQYSQRASNDIMTPCWYVGSLSIAPADYTIGQKLLRQSDNAEFYVVSTKQGALLLQSLMNKAPDEDDVITDILGNVMFTIGQVLPPEVDKFTGTIISYDNREPYRETEDSNVIVRTYIEF
jgi:hypothetical protein